MNSESPLPPRGVIAPSTVKVSLRFFCFSALWNECLQLYNVVGIYAVKRCFNLLKINFHAFEGNFIAGICILF